MGDFNLDKLPTNLFYSESEETKELRHEYYQQKSKFTISRCICYGLIFIAILFYIVSVIEMSNELIKIKTEEELYNLDLSIPRTFQIISIIILLLSIVGLIIIRIVSKNTLKPIEQDIQRSILNDQLELSGAKVNRNRKSNNKNFEDDDSFTDLKNELEDLKEEYEILNNNLSKLQKENSELKQNNKLLKNKNSELETKYNKLIKTNTLTKNINNTNSSLNIKVDENKSSGKGILISLLIISIITFIISLVFTIINFKAQKDILFIIITLVSTLITFFATIIFGILLLPTKNQKQRS